MPRVPEIVEQKRADLLNKVLKAFSLTDSKSWEIYYSDGDIAYTAIKALKDDIITVYPKRNTSRLRKGIQNKSLDSIRALKELLRYYNKTLISSRIQSKNGCTYKYTLLQ